MIFVTGTARSRTSLVAGIVERCGAFGGAVCGPTIANTKGQYEHSYIRQSVVKPYLRRAGADPMGQLPLPNIDKLPPFPELRRTVDAVFRRDGWNGKRARYYKGAKLCLVWPTWHLAFPDAVWITARRSPEDIARSCLQTHFMRAYSKAGGWLRWVAEHEKRFAEMRETAGLTVFEVDTDKLVQGDFTEMRAAVEAAGLTWNHLAVEEFLDPNMTIRSSA